MGNYGCGCSEPPRLEDSLDRTAKNAIEEVIEFEPKSIQQIIDPDLELAVSSKNEKPHSVMETKQSSLLSDFPVHEFQGELLRVQKTPKEIFIYRWCVLTQHSFKYYKSQYSALSQDKPLFEIETEKIHSSNTYVDENKYYIELSYLKDYSNTKDLNQSSNLNSSRRSIKSYKSSLCSNSFDKNLTFITYDKTEWESWKKTLQVCMKPFTSNNGYISFA